MGSVSQTENKIGALAKNYVPEWNYDTDNPDIGSTIARIFARGMDENRKLLDALPDVYHAEFVNMLDISLRPAKPAGSMVKFDIVEDSVPGTFVRRGTRLLSDEVSSDGDPIMFETDRDLYVTSARLTDAFMTDREDGTICPLLGSYAPAEIIEKSSLPEEEEETEEGEQQQEEDTVSFPERHKLKPFTLFAGKNNIARSVLVIYHETIFDTENEPILLRISGNRDLFKQIEEGKLKFKYYTEKGFLEFDSVQALENSDTFVLVKSRVNKKINYNGREVAVVILEAEKPFTENQDIEELKLASRGGPLAPEFVSDGTQDLEVEEFNPFSDTLSVYNECYIGHDRFFLKAGSHIKITFKAEYLEHGTYLTRQEELDELKIIKRKPKVERADIPANAFADEIALEYFNGTGWKKLPLDEDVSRMFGSEKAGEYNFSFICPSDWEPTESGPYNGRSIRLRLVRSDNCYLRPCIHHYPHISHFRIEYSYEENYTDPARLFAITGTKKRDVTKYIKREGTIPVFYSGTYAEDALYLGFDKKMEDGPVSLYFGIMDIINQNALQCRFEYSTIRGFRQMKVADYTGDFSRSGSVRFVPPSDFHRMELEGKKRYWIRISRARIQSDTESELFLPKISSIGVNIVSVSNIITGLEQNFYIDEPEPNMHFALNTQNILDAEVWVNEVGSISKDEMESLLNDRPDDVRAEYNMLGEVSAFYVKWEEADSFLNIPDRRRYTLDRLTNELIFSDSVKADIPRVTDDISFKVRTRVSDGQLGNVGVETINETVAPGLYIDRVTNPVRAYGGSNMETVNEALKRGANILHGRNRLVSVDDYIWTILNFSDSIDKAACVVGETIDGNKDSGYLSFVLLMKDFKEGSFSFHRIAASLKQELLAGSEMTLSPDMIFITEPVFVTVSVSVWAEINEMDDSFETQNMMVDILNSYFDPITDQGHSGWDIGLIPKRTQILMRLGTLKSRAVIRKTVMVASYTDSTGEHEMDLADLKVTPFMVVRSGEHKVHMLYKE